MEGRLRAGPFTHRSERWVPSVRICYKAYKTYTAFLYDTAYFIAQKPILCMVLGSSSPTGAWTLRDSSCGAKSQPQANPRAAL